LDITLRRFPFVSAAAHIWSGNEYVLDALHLQSIDDPPRRPCGALHNSAGKLDAAREPKGDRRSTCMHFPIYVTLDIHETESNVKCASKALMQSTEIHETTRDVVRMEACTSHVQY
jgi:hypothetical protein